MQKPSSESTDLTPKMASVLVVGRSVANNSPSQDSSHPDYYFQSRYVTPGFKPFSSRNVAYFDVAFINLYATILFL